jgi:hypothetical protein
MTMRPSWLAACALRWTRPTQNRIP